VTGIVGSITPCEPIKYQVTLSKPGGASTCAFEGGSLSVVTPDGVNHLVVVGMVPQKPLQPRSEVIGMVFSNGGHQRKRSPPAGIIRSRVFKPAPKGTSGRKIVVSTLNTQELMHQPVDLFNLFLRLTFAIVSNLHPSGFRTAKAARTA